MLVWGATEAELVQLAKTLPENTRVSPTKAAHAAGIGGKWVRFKACKPLCKIRPNRRNCMSMR